MDKIISLIVPSEILESFDVSEVNESAIQIEIILEEKKDLIPEEIKSFDAVLDGFCNPLSILSFPIKGKPTYLVIKRRRWKLAGEDEHYSNSYQFNHPGIKATKEFAAFLKEVHGHTPDEYLRICRDNGC